MRNARLDEAQAGIKIAGRNINNLRYADDTTLMAENEELKSLFSSMQFSSVQLLSHVRLFATPWTAACQASLSITSSWSLPNSCPLSRWCHPTIASSVAPFSSHLQSCLGSISSFFLKLFLHWSLVVYWAPTNLGSSSFNVLSFCLFILLMGFSRQEYWSYLPFPSPVDHFLSELSTMTHPFLVALHSMAHSFIDLDKAVVQVIRLVSFLWLWFQSVCSLMPSLSAYHLTGVSLNLDMWYLLSAIPEPCSHHSWWKKNKIKASWWKWKRRVKKLA